jgi:hypothetical protein
MLLVLPFLLFAVLFSRPTSAQAPNLYIAQSGAGAGNGQDCADALPVSFFNSSGNWGTSSSQIGPGTVVHLCGTISTQLLIQGSGVSGKVIEILWQPGAKLSQPANSLVNLNGHSYLLFDGGSPCGPGTSCSTSDSGTGIIEATNNGSAPLGNHSTNVMAFVGSGGFIEIRNLIIRNLYRHTSASDSTANADGGNLVIKCYTCSGDLSIHDSTIHDSGNTISLEFFSNSPTVDIYKNYFYNYNWAIENSGNGVRTVKIHDNHFGSTTNWDTTNDQYHHNAIHSYMNVMTDSLGLFIYNNLADGDVGTCCATSTLLFNDGDFPNNEQVFNNVIVQSCNANRAPALRVGSSNVTNSYGSVVNNTFVGCSTTSSNIEAIELSGTNITLQNNAIQGFGQYILANNGVKFAKLDNNAYGPPGQSGNPPWQCGSTGASTLAQWRTACLGDANAISSTNLGVSSVGVPSATSVLSTVGASLATQCHSAGLNMLCYDTSDGGVRTPLLRPTNWSAGAYLTGAAGSQPNAPTGLTATVD